MNYLESRQYIDSALKFGIKLGLERIERVLDLMGNPQEKLKIIHVAGTNGKGSVCTMLSGGLTSAGYKVGLFTSPYIVDFRERFMVSGQKISEDHFAQEATKLKALVEQMEREGFEPLTEFEMITAIAYSYFLKMGCDYCVIEVGLGGRYDSTNVIKSPLMSIITSISLDHTNILGGTLEEIAKEKGGIIKENAPLILYPKMDLGAKIVLEGIAKEKNVQVICPDDIKISNVDVSENGTKFVINGQSIHLKLVGNHQIYNFLCVYKAMELLGVDREKFLSGVQATTFVGRFQKIKDNPAFFVDGGHNIDGVEKTCETMDTVFKDKKIIVIMGMMRDKDTLSCVSKIAKRAHTFIGVTVNNERSATASEICKIAKIYCQNVVEAPNVEWGVKRAITLANEDFCIIGCGSLYLLGDIITNAQK